MNNHKSIVITHVESRWSEAEKVKDSIERYINTYNPRVYMLIAESSPLINHGRIYASLLGELPHELREILLEDRNQGHEIIVAGGYETGCLAITIRDLRQSGINPKVFLDGVYPRKSSEEI